MESSWSGEILLTYLLPGLQQTGWILTRCAVNSLSLEPWGESCYPGLNFKLSCEMIEALKLRLEACETAGIKYWLIVSVT